MFLSHACPAGIMPPVHQVQFLKMSPTDNAPGFGTNNESTAALPGLLSIALWHVYFASPICLI